MNDEALNEEDPEFKNEENDKKIFRSLFNSLTPTIYDASWFELDPKITTPFLDFMLENRKTPLVFCFIKTSLNNLYKRLINFDEIEKEYNSIVEKSKKKREEEVEKFVKEKRENGEEVDPEEIKRMLDEPDNELPKLDEMKEDDVEKHISFMKDTGVNEDDIKNWVKGYNKAKSTLYTEEQMIGFSEWILNSDSKKVLTRTKESLLKEYIYSLKQHKNN